MLGDEEEGVEEDDMFFLVMSMMEIADNQAERYETTTSGKGLLARRHEICTIIMVGHTG